MNIFILAVIIIVIIVSINLIKARADNKQDYNDIPGGSGSGFDLIDYDQNTHDYFDY